MASVAWEYRILTGQNTLTEAALNDLGAEGWELVGVTSHVHTDTPFGTQTEIVCVFKRQQQVEQNRGMGSVH